MADQNSYSNLKIINLQLYHIIYAFLSNILETNKS